MNSISIVLPTYNEAENITPMLSALLKMGNTNGYNLNIHVIDDNSPDGTASIVEAASQEFDNIYLVKGKKEGLGKAYIRGFKHVLDEKDPKIVVMMDCDFSHDPFAIPTLVNAIHDGHDYVIGSRYAEGGAIPGDWPIKRIVNSKVANIVATHVGGIDSSVKDISGGFKAIRTSALRGVDYESINTYGYGFQMHLLHLFLQAGHKVHEVPIVFRDRRFGDSKMRLSDIIGFLQCAYGLNPNSSFKKLQRFATVGATGIVINLGVLYLLATTTALPTIAASAIAVSISILTNFILHSTYTFRGVSDNSWRHFAKYSLASTGTALMTVALFSLLHTVVGMYYLLAQFVAICISFFTNYWISDNLIWRKHANR